MKTLLIATNKVPRVETFDQFDHSVRLLMADCNITVCKLGIVPGPGCANLALECCYEHEEDFERAANQLTLCLMPGKWTTTIDAVIQGYHL